MGHSTTYIGKIILTTTKLSWSFSFAMRQNKTKVKTFTWEILHVKF